MFALLQCGHWQGQERAPSGGTVEWCERCQSIEVITEWAAGEYENDYGDECDCGACG